MTRNSDRPGLRPQRRRGKADCKVESLLSLQGEKTILDEKPQVFQPQCLLPPENASAEPLSCEAWSVTHRNRIRGFHCAIKHEGQQLVTV